MNIIDGKTLRTLRRDLRLTQKDFAETCNISLQSLKYYETGRRKLTLEKYQEIKEALGFCFKESDNPLRLMIDYLRITFMDVKDLSTFVEDYLFCQLTDFKEEDKSLLGFNHLWKRGDIWILDFFDKEVTGNRRISIQLSGQGCRQLELILESKGLDWHFFLRKMVLERSDMRVTRLDLALDELYRGPEHEDEQFYLSDLISLVYRDMVQFASFKKWSHIGGGSLREDESQGISLYFGSRKSNKYFNFYEKRFELAQKEGVTVEEALEIFEIWNRYEIRLAHEYAQEIVEEFVEGQDLGHLARGMVLHEIMVYSSIGKNGAYIPDPKWQDMFGSALPLKLSVKPEPYSIERTVRWLLYQVSNSLKFVDKADKIMNTNYLEMIQNSGELTERMQGELEVLRTNFRLMEEGKSYP